MGSPPPPDRLIRFEDGSFYVSPMALELLPLAGVRADVSVPRGSHRRDRFTRGTRGPGCGGPSCRSAAVPMSGLSR